MPCPPDVPGSQAAIKADDGSKISSINIGLPESKTLTNGIVLSAPFIISMTFDSKLDN